MAERHTPKSANDDREQHIPPKLHRVSSMPYVPPVGQTESNSVQPARTHDQIVDGDLTPRLGEISGSSFSSTELGNTAVPLDTFKPCPEADQGAKSGCDDNVNHRITDTPDSTAPQGSEDERAHQEGSYDDGHHERKSTKSRSPSNPLSPTDDGSGTDVTEYDEEDSGMDAADGLPDWHGEE